MHVAQHEVQQEGLSLPKGSSHRNNHHIQVLHVILQQDLLQCISIQLKAVVTLICLNNLDRPGLFALYSRLKTGVCNERLKRLHWC